MGKLRYCNRLDQHKNDNVLANLLLETVTGEVETSHMSLSFPLDSIPLDSVTEESSITR